MTTLLTPDIIAREALMVLRNNAVMANLVHRDFSEEFVAGVGDTITVRKPATFEAKEFSTEDGITIQDATEDSVSVTMDKLLDVSFAVTSKQMSLDISDFSNQLLVPAMQAFADKIDKYLLNLGAGVTNRVSATSTAKDDIVDARALIKGAPLTERSFVCGTDLEAKLLKTDLFVHADKVGDDGTALREASLGRKYGMDFYVDQNVDGGRVDGLAFHKNAFALVSRPLELPQGAAKSATVSYDGFGLRVVYGYDIAKKTDTVSIDMLCGVKLLDERLAAVIESAGA